jgi:hypothetical protein
MPHLAPDDWNEHPDDLIIFIVTRVSSKTQRPGPARHKDKIRGVLSVTLWHILPSDLQPCEAILVKGVAWLPLHLLPTACKLHKFRDVEKAITNSWDLSD